MSEIFKLSLNKINLHKTFHKIINICYNSLKYNGYSISNNNRKDYIIKNAILYMDTIVASCIINDFGVKQTNNSPYTQNYCNGI